MASKIWTYLKPIFDAIIFSNIWIALAALSLFSTVLKVSGNTKEFYAALTIFSSTFIAYNFLKLNGIEHVANNSVFFKWLRKYKFIVYTLIVIAFITLAFAFFQLTKLQIYACVVSVVIALFYVGFKEYNLRHFWFLKTPMVAFVWAFFIVSLAFVNIFETVSSLKLTYIFLACFLFIQGLTIPFEIRDLKADVETVGLKTIPMIVGVQKTKYIAILHLILALLFFMLFDFRLLILTPIILIAILVITQLNKNSSEYNYTLVLDGLIVMTFPLVDLIYY